MLAVSVKCLISFTVGSALCRIFVLEEAEAGIESVMFVTTDL